MYKATTKFLVVDDFSNMRKIIKRILNDMGYFNAVEAVDGQAAYEALVEHSKTNQPIDVVIADWNMPNMNGLDLLKLIRSEEGFKKLPFMMVTAESEQTQILEALKTGVTEYVVKPFTPVKLKEKLESCYKKCNPAQSKAG